MAMTEARLAEIRAFLHQHREMQAWPYQIARALLAEVERLRACEAALPDIVRRMAAESLLHGVDGWRCGQCDGMPVRLHAEFQHTHDCPVTQARALLANKETTQ